MIDLALDDFIRRTLEEDLGNGDITTIATIPAETEARGKIIAKEDGVICGLAVAARVFALLDPTIVMDCAVSEGSEVKKGDLIAVVSGNARTLLSAERTALNLMQRLSGIATRTRTAVRAVEGTKTKIVDTRKTTPLMRNLEKYAVRVGGGTNHRTGLSDGVLIKDNHIVAAGGITAAVTRARTIAPHTLKIEVEIENFEQLAEALNAGADIIMLDNMSNEDMKKAVAIVNGKALTEASGNMGEKDLRAVAECGVDLISIGSLTHSVKALDISMKFTVL